MPDIIKAEPELLKISDDFEVPLLISVEYKAYSKVSIGKKGVYVRLSRWLPEAERQQQIETFKNWAVEKLRKHHYGLKPPVKNYVSGQLIQARGREFILQLTEKEDTRYRARINNGVIMISMPVKASAEEKQKSVKTLISKCLANLFYKEIGERLVELNDTFFKKTITGFSLKYTQTRWGSCSPTGSISISTRLLLAPPAVMDYVLIHELAHLIHHNHSKSFWNEVKRAMPDFREHEKWLKENHEATDF